MNTDRHSTARIAVIVPCHNEQGTIAKVIADFRQALPDADIFVFDNDSSDATAVLAHRGGAQVQHVSLRDKGHVVCRMFADVDADIYVMVDGDDTCPAGAAPLMVWQLQSRGLDMLVGVRTGTPNEADPFVHRLGNWLLARCVSTIFDGRLHNLLSGYRVFSRRYVKSFPGHAPGFEIETELTVHALELHMPIAEVNVSYQSRRAGSTSKLHTRRDGWRIPMTILRLVKSERPQAFFGLGFSACIALAVGLAVPLVQTFLATGLVPRFPTAILCASLVLLGAISLTCGLILGTVVRGRVEMKRLAYLTLPAPAPLPE